MVRADELPPMGWQETLALLAGEMAARLPATAAELLASALEREASEPTYLGKGMALPHARVAGLGRAGICVAHAARGIAWHEERAQLVIFVAVPEEAPELYLKLLSKLVRWRLRLSDEALAAAPIPAGAWQQELQGIIGGIAG